MGGSHRLTSVRGADLVPSYKYYANMMGTVNATFDTFFQNQQTNFTNHISGTVHGSLILTTDEYQAGGIAVELYGSDGSK